MLRVGKGYDSAKKIEKPLSAFGDSLEIVEQLAASFDFSLRIYNSTWGYDNSSMFSLSTGLGIPFVAGPNIRGALEVSRTLSTDQNILIYVLHVRGVRKQLSAVLDQPAFATDIQFQEAKNELRTNPDDFCSKYGDAFVKTAFCGGEVALVIKFDKKAIESSRQIIHDLVVRLPNSVDLTAAIKLLRNQEYRDLKCEIYTHTTGFTAEQLPPADPQKFADLSGWLTAFAEKFHNIPVEAFQTVVGIEVESYGVIIPEETVAIQENTAIRARYFFALFRCRMAIEFYITYYHWVGNVEELNTFDLKRQELENIKAIFDIKQNLSGPVALKTVAALKVMIEELNAVVIPPKLVDEFKSTDLGRNISSQRVNAEQRISPTFKLPSFPDELGPDYFIVEVSKGTDTNKIRPSPLVGQLSLLYSWNDRVPFDGVSFPIATHINLGESHASIPPNLNDNSQLTAVTLAYHLQVRRSAGLAALSSCVRPCVGTGEEEFLVRTYVVGKRPGPIMPIID